MSRNSQIYSTYKCDNDLRVHQMSTKHSKASELKDRDRIIHELLKRSSVFSKNGQHQSFKEFDTTIWGKSIWCMVKRTI